MPPDESGPEFESEARQMTAWSLLWADLRRSRRRSTAGFFVAVVAAMALFGATWTLRGMHSTLDSDMKRLGADIVVVPKGQAGAAEQLLMTGSAPPVPASIPVLEWKNKLTPAFVYGIVQLQGWSLEVGGEGKPSGKTASALFIRLDRFASPMITRQLLILALPPADIVVAEQATRQVTRHLQVLLDLLGVGAVVGLVGCILISGLLASITVNERRAELGMLRAMGATRSFLLNLVLAESGIPALVGGVVGALLTAGVILLTGGVESFSRLAWYGIGSALAVVAAAALSALVPALRAAWLDPLEASRR